MSFSEFLKLCQTLRSLYDKPFAQLFFEKNVGQYYKLGDSFQKDSLQGLDFDIQ